MWTKNLKITLATSYKENLYKMFYRWHLPPSRLAKISANISNKCWKCKNQEPITPHGGHVILQGNIGLKFIHGLSK